MCFGMPIICSKYVGTAKDMIEDNSNGFIVEPSNYDSIKSAVEVLLVKGNREAMSKQSLEKIENFSPKVCASNINSIILRVI